MKTGQTLVLLLVFMAMAVVVTTAAVAMIITNSQAGVVNQQGETSLALAESGVEEAMLRLLRDPGYVGGTLTTENGAATISVSGLDPKTVISTASVGSFSRKVETIVNYTNGVLTVQSWKQIE